MNGVGVSNNHNRPLPVKIVGAIVPSFLLSFFSSTFFRKAERQKSGKGFYCEFYSFSIGLRKASPGIADLLYHRVRAMVCNA